jgi:hypothetical protein
MCFRPAQVSMNVCPKCGKENKPIATICGQCGAELEKMVVDMDADQAKLDAHNIAQGGMPISGTPKSPSVPGMPVAPAAPGALGKPAAPAAPSAPGKSVR